MAEINIKIFDTPTGGIDLDAVFDPEYKPSIHKATPAQNFAGHVLQYIAVTAQEIRKHYAEAEGVEDTNSKANEETLGQEEVQTED